MLLLPHLSQAQTVHRKGNKVLYQGDVVVSGRTASQVFTDLQNVAGSVVKRGKEAALMQANGKVLSTYADLRLPTESIADRTVHYTIQLTAQEGGYTYRIDSVSVTEKKQDGSESTKTAKDLLAGLEESGPAAAAAEKVLNEIDMNFQKLLALLRTGMQKKKASN